MVGVLDHRLRCLVSWLCLPACLPACLQGIPNGQEMELTTMIIECCSNEKTFIKCVSNNSSAWAGGPG